MGSEVESALELENLRHNPRRALPTIFEAKISLENEEENEELTNH